MQITELHHWCIHLQIYFKSSTIFSDVFPVKHKTVVEKVENKV